MAKRLQLIQQHIAKKTVNSAFDYLSLQSFLTKEENDVRLAFRKFSDQNINDKINPYVQEAKFPEYLIPKLRQIEALSYFFKKPYGKGFRVIAQGALLAELARGDAGVATFFLVQFALLGYTIEALGSEEQKAKYLPKIINWEQIGGWGLTEDKIGSDASNLTTSVLKEAGGYKINGTKRWIGNGDRDLLISWSRNAESKKVQAFILQTKGLAGYSPQIIKNKLALRVVQNCHITMKDVFVKEEQKLPKATDFQNGVNVILKHSRVFVCWVAVGIAQGVYDHSIKYTSQRNQFGRSIAGFQLIQEKLVKIMANTQAILLLTFRISQLIDEGKASIGQIALTKAYVTDKLRDVTRWGREIFGGNGIIHDNYVMKALADAEAIFTYEGTYDINSLVAGRELTGLAAFSK